MLAIREDGVQVLGKYSDRSCICLYQALPFSARYNIILKRLGKVGKTLPAVLVVRP